MATGRAARGPGRAGPGHPGPRAETGLKIFHCDTPLCAGMHAGQCSQQVCTCVISLLTDSKGAMTFDQK